MPKAWLVGLAAITVLSGCGNSGSSGGPGTYSVEGDGTVLNVSVPAPSDSTLVSAIEAYQQKVGSADDLVFLSQELVNSAADTAAHPCPAPRVVTEEGQTLKFKSAFQIVGELQNLVPQGDTSLYKEGVSLYNSLLDAKALPGATTTSLYVAKGPLPSIKSVFSGVAVGDTLPIAACESQLDKLQS